MLTLKIKEQDIFVSNSQQYVKGTVGAKCKVVFDPCWKDYNRTIVFKPAAKFSGGPIPVYVPDMTAELTIPWEVMSKVGSFKIGAYGTTDELTTPTLWCEPIDVVDGTDTSGTAPKDPSPNVYNQLITIANEAVSVAQSVRNDADTGKFDGEKGDKGDKGDAGAIKFIVVAELPEVGDEDTIYLLPVDLEQDHNIYEEYIFTNGAWEKIGSASVEVDLTDYVKNTDYATAGVGGVIKLSGAHCTAADNGVLRCVVRSFEEYGSLSNGAFVSKGTLDNVLAEKIGDIETLLGGI